MLRQNVGDGSAAAERREVPPITRQLMLPTTVATSSWHVIGGESDVYWIDPRGQSNSSQIQRVCVPRRHLNAASVTQTRPVITRRPTWPQYEVLRTLGPPCNHWPPRVVAVALMSPRHKVSQ